MWHALVAGGFTAVGVLAETIGHIATTDNIGKVIAEGSPNALLYGSLAGLARYFYVTIRDNSKKKG